MPSGRRLPIGLSTLSVSPYTYRSTSRTAMQAREQAFSELEQLLAKESEGRTLLQKTTQTRVDENGITLMCTVICEEDIALTMEFELAQQLD